MRLEVLELRGRRKAGSVSQMLPREELRGAGVWGNWEIGLGVSRWQQTGREEDARAYSMSFRNGRCSFSGWRRDCWKVTVGIGRTLPQAPGRQVQEMWEEEQTGSKLQLWESLRQGSEGTVTDEAHNIGYADFSCDLSRALWLLRTEVEGWVHCKMKACEVTEQRWGCFFFHEFMWIIYWWIHFVVKNNISDLVFSFLFFSTFILFLVWSEYLTWDLCSLTVF